ncbi:MAG: DUF2281 domain-containing protein [Salinivirgaceae bacterium]|jgi:hypothetical protein
MNTIAVISKFETLPPKFQMEVSDFMDFLIEKSSKTKKKIIPKFGSAKGKIRLSSDFDAPLDDFKEYM